MLRMLEGTGTPTEWELMLRREMKLKAVGCRKKVFAGLTLTPTTGKKSVIEAWAGDIHARAVEEEVQCPSGAD
jgi:hypothetical protein